MVFLNCSAVATTTTAQAHCATFTVNGPYAQPSACESFFIRAKKCNSDPEKSLADVQRIRATMARSGLSLEVEACYPQTIRNQRTGEIKRFDWGAMILEIRAYGMDGACASGALNSLKVDCSFQDGSRIEFDVWRQPVDGASLLAEMAAHGQKTPSLLARRASTVPLTGDDSGHQHFVVLRKRVLV